jgi:mRNA interferase HicA
VNCCGGWAKNLLLTNRTVLSDDRGMKGAEFERKLLRLAAKKGASCFFVTDKGKGSHGRLYLGSEFTTLKDRKKEIGKGLLGKMCGDLKIRAEDL